MCMLLFKCMADFAPLIVELVLARRNSYESSASVSKFCNNYLDFSGVKNMLKLFASQIKKDECFFFFVVVCCQVFSSVHWLVDVETSKTFHED